MLNKSIMFPVVFFFLFIFSTHNLYAADCGNATITKIGINPLLGDTGATPYMVRLDCGDDSVWSGTVAFYLSEDLGQPGLATLLAAYSLKKTLWVRTMGIVDGSIITVIYTND